MVSDHFSDDEVQELLREGRVERPTLAFLQLRAGFLLAYLQAMTLIAP